MRARRGGEVERAISVVGAFRRTTVSVSMVGRASARNCNHFFSRRGGCAGFLWKEEWGRRGEARGSERNRAVSAESNFVSSCCFFVRRFHKLPNSRRTGRAEDVEALTIRAFLLLLLNLLLLLLLPLLIPRRLLPGSVSPKVLQFTFQQKSWNLGFAKMQAGSKKKMLYRVYWHQRSLKSTYEGMSRCHMSPSPADSSRSLNHLTSRWQRGERLAEQGTFS